MSQVADADRPTSWLGQKPGLLRVAEVGVLLGVSRRQVYKWITFGVIPREVVLRAGRAVYIKRVALEQWLALSGSGTACLPIGEVKNSNWCG